MKTSCLSMTCIATLLHSGITLADGSQGTGRQEPTVQLSIGADQRAILSLDDGQQLIVGSGSFDQGYSQLNLDAFGDQQSQSGWGYAEVLLGCDKADILVYRQVDGQLQEMIATQVAIDSCP